VLVKLFLGEVPFSPLLLQQNTDSIYIFVVRVELIYDHQGGSGRDQRFQVMGFVLLKRSCRVLLREIKSKLLDLVQQECCHILLFRYLGSGEPPFLEGDDDGVYKAKGQ